MIIDHVAQLERYIPVLPPLETVVTVLREGKLATLPYGSYHTENPRVRYNLFAYDTEKTQSETYEIHKKEVDVQILLSGRERMDIADANHLILTAEYDPAKDASFAKGRALVSYHADTSTFALFFPGEPHAPNLVDEVPTHVVKVVFKILMD
ncbi:MAG: YhcH/YjgK/YiaL family protein [Sphaerochaeta sp.]|jgi:YhcH/YjgK/YiaL family protein|uniref:YhcH/YjgK/YiaL family protein n=1 Tax=Sphaerochaeta sp. TaxID=1972642 RepID=UPI002FCBA786